MAVYSYKGAALTGDTLRLTEHHLYGSSRLGIWARRINMDLPPQNGVAVNLLGQADTLSQWRGNKLFELSNHLGNVLATVSDRRGQVNANSDTLVDYFTPDVVTANDYYPFGMLMQQTEGDGSGVGAGGTDSAMEVLTVSNRTGNTPAQYTATNSVEFTSGFESGTGDSFTAFITGSVEGGGNGGSSTEGGSSIYRYGFNGQEHSDEIRGDGNSYTAEFWEYDPRTGRRWNVDPVFKDYESPYVVMGNNPIWNIDPDGADTTKTSELAGQDLTAAAKTASSMVAKLLKEKHLNTVTSAEEDKQLAANALAYSQKNNLNFWGTLNYYGVLKNYFRGLEDMAWWRGSDFTDVDKNIIQNEGLDDFTKLSKMENRIAGSGKEMVDVVSLGAKTALFISSLALFPNVGAAPKGIQTAPVISTSFKMGKIVGWGETQTAIAAQTTRNVTQNLTRAQVQAFANQGLTKQWVQEQLRLYGKAVLNANKLNKNMNLLPRKELMEKILYLWPK